MNTAHRAYVNARVRARRTRLLDVDGIVRFARSDDDATERALVDVYSRLVAEYRFALRVSPDDADVFVALLRLHELENVKLAWRAVVYGRALEAGSGWRPLGAIETLSLDACRATTSARGLVDVMRRTPYARVAETVARAHATDLEAAELEFDRWAVGQLQDAAQRLPRRERVARTLLDSVVDERAMLGSIRGGRATVAQLGAIRVGRKVATRRAYREHPYSAAPLIAYVLERDAEARGLIAAAELRAARADVDTARRVLEAVM